MFHSYWSRIFTVVLNYLQWSTSSVASYDCYSWYYLVPVTGYYCFSSFYLLNSQTWMEPSCSGTEGNCLICVHQWWGVQLTCTLFTWCYIMTYIIYLPHLGDCCVDNHSCVQRYFLSLGMPSKRTPVGNKHPHSVIVIKVLYKVLYRKRSFLTHSSFLMGQSWRRSCNFEKPPHGFYPSLGSTSR